MVKTKIENAVVQMKNIEIILNNFPKENYNNFINFFFERAKNLTINQENIKLIRFVGFVLKNKLHIFISSKLLDNSKSKNMSIRPSFLFNHFYPSFPNSSNFSIEFFTYKQLDFKNSLAVKLSKIYKSSRILE